MYFISGGFNKRLHVTLHRSLCTKYNGYTVIGLYSFLQSRLYVIFYTYKALRK